VFFSAKLENDPLDMLDKAPPVRERVKVTFEPETG
jgi:hypothetical protein